MFASMRATTRSGALLSAANEAGVEVEVLALDVASEASVQAAVHHVVSVAGRWTSLSTTRHRSSTRLSSSPHSIP